MALDRRRVGQRKRPQNQSLSLNGRRFHACINARRDPIRRSSIEKYLRMRIFVPSLLALRAPEGRAPVLGEAPDDAAAARGLAFLAFAVVDLERMLEIAELARGLAMIAQR